MSHVRPATQDDTEALIASIQAYYAYDHIPFDEASIRRGLVALAAHPEWGGAWLLCVGDEVAGHLLLTYGFDLEFGGRQATLTELYISPVHRRAGLGRLAMAHVAELLRAQGITALELQVEADNHEARAFYDALGFQAYDRVPMSLRIPSQGGSQGVRAR
jgi:ribosomal protein S18 acetylase RimI-like enzyme